MTMQEKIIEKVRRMLKDKVIEELQKKYPEASLDEIEQMIEDYNSGIKEPI